MLLKRFCQFSLYNSVGELVFHAIRPNFTRHRHAVLAG